MGCRIKGMSVQEYRESYPYRKEYFKRNPGLFGCVWFCSQCYRPLFGQSQVYVDHIQPLNKGGLNHVSNCTAICRKCNLSKSDKVDSRVLKGKAFKLVEQSFSDVNRGVGGVAKLGLGLTAATVSATAGVGKSVGKTAVKAGGRGVFALLGFTLKAATFPLRRGSFLSRLVFLAIYALIIMFVLQKYTTLLDAWV